MLTARRVAYYPYATPDDLEQSSLGYQTPDDLVRFDGLGAVKLTPAQIADYARQIAGFTHKATWTIDTNTVAVFMKITDCADQDAVAKMAVTSFVGKTKAVQGSLAEARKRYLGAHKAASTTVMISGLVRPEWLVEIDALAIAP